MAFLDSSTAVIDAILTRKGRELLARNDGSFQITKFAFISSPLSKRAPQTFP